MIIEIAVGILLAVAIVAALYGCSRILKAMNWDFLGFGFYAVVFLLPFAGLAIAVSFEGWPSLLGWGIVGMYGAPLIGWGVEAMLRGIWK